jgi:hypothetical protein
MRSMIESLCTDGNQKRIRNHLMLLGPVFIASLTLWPAETSQAATISNSAKAAVTATDPQPPSNSERAYREDYQKGHEAGLAEAKQFNCLKSPAWRPRAWYERQNMAGFFDGYEAAYDEVCGVNRPTEKAPLLPSS